MQPLLKTREVISGGTIDSTAFTISMKDQAHIKSILRDTLYSDKILAVLREYSANAWDAHRMAGKPDLPIKVQIPTWGEPVLIIQDWGTGLSHEDVFEVFAKYGASTKRESNEAVGMLGIGSKSGFAYSDTFTIISRHGGKARTYVALLDESENDAISLLSEEDCGDDTGITIQIAVKPEDIMEFERKARNLFQHFIPRPDINIDLPPVSAIHAKLQHGMIYDREVRPYEDSQWFAVMGCVPYRVDFNQLKGSDGKSLISETFKQTSGLLTFKIGEIQINASREALKYSKVTKEALVQKFEALLDEFVTVTLDEIEKSTCSNWEKRIQAQTLLRLGLGKKEIGDWGLSRIDFKNLDSFRVTNRYGGCVNSFDVSSDTRFIRKDDDRDIEGFHLQSGNYFIEPKLCVVEGQKPEDFKPYSWDVVNAELEKMLLEHKADGITIIDLHTLPWQPKPKVVRPKGLINIKHKVSTFRMTGNDTSSRGLSKNWEIENRAPTANDVFVILNGFATEAVAGQRFNIYDCHQEDVDIADFFGLTLPPIYGYKTTEKKPVTADKLTGMHYPEWRKKFLAELPADKVKKLIEEQIWSEIAADEYGYAKYSGIELDHLQTNLGKDHPIVAYLAKAMEFKDKFELYNRQILHLLDRLGAVNINDFEARQIRRSIHEKYPLLAIHTIESLWREHSTEWCRYVHLVDQMTKDVPTVPEEKVEG